eukprot:3157414-Amphidinium_carterae.1
MEKTKNGKRPFLKKVPLLLSLDAFSFFPGFGGSSQDWRGGFALFSFGDPPPNSNKPLLCSSSSSWLDKDEFDAGFPQVIDMHEVTRTYADHDTSNNPLRA